MTHARAGPLVVAMAVLMAASDSGANGIRGEPPPPPPSSKVPCCYLENQLAYNEALYAAWACTLALPKELQSMFTSGGGTTPDRGCWLGAFDSRCALPLYESYRPVPEVSGQYYILDRLKREIKFLKSKLEDCDANPNPNHPLLRYCKNYCDAPELYGHKPQSAKSSTKPSNDPDTGAPSSTAPKKSLRE